MSAAARLRQQIEGEEILLVPGVTSALYGRLAEQAGMDAVFTTGAGIANTDLGVPDLGFTTMSEVVEANRKVVSAVGIPVIADADTGYGGHLNVIRTVTLLEQAGVGGLILEDQREPKRCGHFAGKTLVEPHEMIEKLVAARQARRDPGLVLIARTDAIAVEGFDAAIARAKAYVAAGADMVFVEAPRTREEIAAIPAAVGVPCMINLVEGGKTPLLPLEELRAMGFRLALYANLALRVAAQSVRDAFATLREDGDTQRLLDRMLKWEERQGLVGFDAWQERDQAIAEEARRIAEAAAGEPA